MHQYFYLVLCVIAMLVGPLANAQTSKQTSSTVEVAASIDRQKENADQYSVTVQFNIKDGWHIYDDIGDGTEIPTSVKLKLPKGAEASGQWKRPLGLEVGDESLKTAYEGKVSFSRTVVVDPSAADQEIGVIVRFQACNDRICNRPQKQTLSVRIENQEASTEVFEKPVRILAVEKSRLRFKSPAIFDVDGDGQDELFVGSLMGSIDIYENKNADSTGDPVWVQSEPLQSADDDIRTSNWCCVGASSQFVDINTDGQKDILIGSFSGVPQWIESTKDGWKEPTDLLDKNGDAVLISKFWNNETDEWDETDRSGTTGHCASVAAVDWDGDGDIDLLLGAVDLLGKKSGMYVRLNEGNAKENRFSTKNQPVEVGGSVASIEGGVAAPRVVDWNGDGLFDIVIGTIRGGVLLLENTGNKREPAFDQIQTLVEPLPGQAGSKTVKQVDMKDGGPIGPGSSFHVEPVDYDGDGDLDLLVGARCKWFTDDKEPTQEDLDRAKELKSKSSKAYTQSQELKRTAKTDEEEEEIRSSKEYRELIRKYHQLRSESLKLGRKPTETIDSIWLYRQK